MFHEDTDYYYFANKALHGELETIRAEKSLLEKEVKDLRYFKEQFVNTHLPSVERILEHHAYGLIAAAENFRFLRDCTPDEEETTTTGE